MVNTKPWQEEKVASIDDWVEDEEIQAKKLGDDKQHTRQHSGQAPQPHGVIELHESRSFPYFRYSKFNNHCSSSLGIILMRTRAASSSLLSPPCKEHVAHPSQG